MEAVSEVGSSLNGRRPKLLKLLANPQIQRIVVEHRDRFKRFGAEYIEAALAARGRKLMVMESSEVKDDLVQDMIEVLTWFCARLYGRRWPATRQKSSAGHGAIRACPSPKHKAFQWITSGAGAVVFCKEVPRLLKLETVP